MAGFQNQLLNQNFKQRFYDTIITSLITGCKLMVEDCSKHHFIIENHEEKIRTHLLENYLENDKVRPVLGLEGVPVRFIPEASENYDKTTDTYIGRTDIRVVSSNWLKNRKDYYTVECKRIDGTQPLNKKYVDEGICRFTGETPKYTSFNGKNIMIGFFVKNIDPVVTIEAIAHIHERRISRIMLKNLTVLKNAKDYCLCESSYVSQLSLSHIFYNISSVVSS